MKKIVMDIIVPVLGFSVFCLVIIVTDCCIYIRNEHYLYENI